MNNVLQRINECQVLVIKNLNQPELMSKVVGIFLVLCVFYIKAAPAQQAPGTGEILNYNQLFYAAAGGNVGLLLSELEKGIDLEQKDNNGRTALLVATHFSHDQVVRELLEHGADSNAMDYQDYDLLTIAAVNNDTELIKLGLKFGADPAAITSPYQGTALIAAARLGHIDAVELLINAGAPLNHFNILGWTALFESIVLGVGGTEHTLVLKLLVEAGADVSIGDRQGVTPLNMARQLGFDNMVTILRSGRN